MDDSAVPYRRVGIVGVGAIGSGIAQLVSSLGVETVIVAPRPGGVERARQMMQRCFEGDVRRGRIDAAQAEAGLANIRVTPDYADLAGAEFVIESAPEDLEIKLDVLRAVEANTGSDCIFGTNTSSIPIARIAQAASRPYGVIGMHYFWPAPRFQLVEISSATMTSATTIDRTLAMVRWQGKTPLLVRDSPGFFTTRILIPYINESVALLAEGASIEAVDQAMIDFGWAMGPFRLMDAAGIETLARVYTSVRDFMGDRVRSVELLWPVIRAGHVGYKGAQRTADVKGFYLYPEGREADSRIYSLVRQNSAATPTEQDISRRPVWQMVNEVAHCLTEGIVASPEEADLGAVLGIGWPRSREGPMAYARQIGPEVIVAQLEAWAAEHGPRFRPSRTLLELSAKAGLQ